MTHSKCYAICENKCKVETLPKETLDYRYSQTDTRLLKLHSEVSFVYKKASECEQNIYTLKNTTTSLNTKVTGAENKANYITEKFIDFYGVEWADLLMKVNQLENRIEELEKNAK